MTTTTFTAPLTRLWVQAKILKWMVVLLGLLFAVSIGLGNARSEIGMAGFFLALSFVTLLATISGPVVFGAEFTEGASDYLATRPISPRMVFGIKTVVIMIYCAVCAYLTRKIMGSNAPYLAVVLFPIYLNLAFWCAAATLLTKDTVRGLLYGGFTFIPLMYLVTLANTVLFSDPIVDESGRNFPWSRLDAFPFMMGLFTPIYFAFSPLLFLGMLSMANHFCYFQRVGFPLTGKVSLTLLAGFLLFAKAILWCDGSAYVSPFVGGYGVSAARVGENSLILLETYTTGAILSSVDLEGEARETTYLGAIPSSTDSSVTGSLLTEDRALIVWWREKSRHSRQLLYDVSEPSNPTEMGSLGIEGYISQGKYLGDNLIEATVRIGHATRPTETRVVQIDLSDGSINAVPPEIESATRLVGLPIDGPAAYKEELIAVCPQELGYTTIHLAEAIETGEPTPTEIVIPLKLRIQSKMWDLQKSGFDFLRSGYPPVSLGFAGDYLIAWFEWGRCAFWDVTDFKNPRFLGDCPTPLFFDSMATSFAQQFHTMFRSELVYGQAKDGSLVFPSTDNGILWLEFPALMKEAKEL